MMLFKSDNIVHFRAQGNDENGPNGKCLRYSFAIFLRVFNFCEAQGKGKGKVGQGFVT